MTALTNHAETLLLTWLMSAGAATRPAAWHVGLHTADPGETGATAELNGNGYARQAASFTISGNEATNAAQLAFGPNTGSAWGNVTHVSIWDAPTGGNCLAKGPLAAAVAMAVSDTLTIAAGALDLTLD